MREKVNYNVVVIKILYELGIHKRYKGVKYILSCINYIENNKMNYSPVTKILYVDVAKLHNTSNYNVEKGIREIIERIWNCEGNRGLIEKIFGRDFISSRPTNTTFLIGLYTYIKTRSNGMSEWIDDYEYMCPKCKIQCPHYKDIVMDVIFKKYC